MVTLGKRKKKSYTKKIAETTALNVASTTGVIAMNSLPVTTPAMEGAKSFAGKSFGMMTTIKSAGDVLSSVKDLEKLSKKRKRKR